LDLCLTCQNGKEKQGTLKYLVVADPRKVLAFIELFLNGNTNNGAVFFYIIYQTKAPQSAAIMNLDSQLNRRKFLKSAGLAIAGTAFGVSSLPFNQSLAATKALGTNSVMGRVNVSPDRVVRTVVGLRPFRPTGFVLKAEKIDSKTIVHNYGHGGGGISLSWGTSTLAVDLALQTQATSFAVLGCGVMGLSTARLLQLRGFPVTIYAKDLPPNTTSNIAAAQWSPVSVYEHGKETTGFMEQFNLASRISNRTFQNYAGDKYGIRWLKNLFLGSDYDYPGGTDLYTEKKQHNDPKTYFGFDMVTEMTTMMIEPPVYLNALLQDFYIAGGKIVVRTFDSLRDVVQLKEKVIINCTGLGAGKLFNDTEIMPIRGQLAVLLPQPEIDYAYIVPSYEDLLYMFPRKDGIILGGTFDYGNWSTEPDAGVSERILNGHRRIASS
jgi:D-amino-acid oxidase